MHFINLELRIYRLKSRLKNLKKIWKEVGIVNSTTIWMKQRLSLLF